MLMMYSLLSILILITLNLNNWVSLWLMNEMMNFIMSLIMKKKVSSSIKFYIYQSMVSTLMIITLMMNNSSIMNNNKMNSLMLLLIIMKLNFYPFHQWMIPIMKTINWITFFNQNYLYKIPNFMMLKLMTIQIKTIMMSLVLFMMLIMKTLNYKIIMFTSSLNNLPWFILTLKMNSKLWSALFIIYMWMNYNMISLLNQMKVTLINQMNSFNKMNQIKMKILTFNIMSIPPLPLFMMKWIMIMLMNNSMYLLFMMISNNLNLTFFMKSTINMFMKKQMKKSWMKMNTHNYSTQSMIMIWWSLFFTMI